jgi:hypothetical protein
MADDNSFQIVFFSSSEHLSESENKLLMDLGVLCSSISRNALDDPKKKHIRETVDLISRQLLHKNLDPNQ